MKKISEMTLAECQGMTIGEILKALEEEFNSNSNDTKKSEAVRIIEQLTEENEMDFETTVSYALREIGIPVHVKGDRYLRYAIMKVIKEPELINAITTELCPAVAKQCNTTRSNVERNVRTAIKIAWNKADEEGFSAYFGYSKKDGTKPPTLSQFIVAVAEKLRIRFRMQGKL